MKHHYWEPPIALYLSLIHIYILKQAESFTDRVNIHVIQCDARVQEDTKITSLDDLELYLESMELKGFGGTDFRPVFDYVNQMCIRDSPRTDPCRPPGPRL